MILLPVQPWWDPVRSTIQDERREDASAPDLHPRGGIMGVEIVDPTVLREGFDNHHLLGSIITTTSNYFSERGIVTSGA